MSDWIILAGIVAAALAADLVLHRRWSAASLRSAFAWTAVWVSLGLSFGAYVFASHGATVAGEYYAGYLIEWSLSVDNVFVFAVLFSYFGVPRRFQHRVLFWGVLGALVFRIVFILAGVELLTRFTWTTYSLGAFVAAGGVWMLFRRREVDVDRHPVIRIVRRIAPVTSDYRGDRFIVRDHGVAMATPLLVLLVVVETTDVAFAIDSIPAVLAVTSNGFVVVASNAFAVLGLRSLYFCVAGAMGRFTYLRFGLAAVLLFVGVKLLLVDVIGEIPIGVAFAVIVAAVGSSLVASEVSRRRKLPGGSVRASSLRAWR